MAFSGATVKLKARRQLSREFCQPSSFFEGLPTIALVLFVFPLLFFSHVPMPAFITAPDFSSLKQGFQQARVSFAARLSVML
eukprot:6204427-Pleurochrysis_carterae.AAC.3